jgi:hypothetical protein
MFERYTDRARRSVVIAQGEARMARHREWPAIAGLSVKDGTDG